MHLDGTQHAEEIERAIAVNSESLEIIQALKQLCRDYLAGRITSPSGQAAGPPSWGLTGSVNFEKEAAAPEHWSQRVGDP